MILCIFSAATDRCRDGTLHLKAKTAVGEDDVGFVTKNRWVKGRSVEVNPVGGGS